MTALHQSLRDYLRLRRGLGYELERDELELEKFVAFLERAGSERITTELALRWAKMPANQHPVVWRHRLSRVRGFARYAATTDASTEIPPQDLLRAHQPRTPPYIYSSEEISQLMAAARSLQPALTAATLATVIGLMDCTGIRMREAIALDRVDVDLEDGVLDIRASHNRRQRLVPLHPTTTTALTRYVSVRDEQCPHPATPAFFVTKLGRRVLKTSFWLTFRELIRESGLEGRGERVRPRPHDLRH